MKTGLSFDDVLIVPRFSDVMSRKDVSLSWEFGTVPVISSPMDTVTDGRVAGVMSRAGGVGVVHRFWSVEKQLEEISYAYGLGRYQNYKDPIIGAAFGLSDEDLNERLPALLKSAARLYVLDVAHGNHLKVQRFLENIHKYFEYENVRRLIVGSFASVLDSRNVLELLNELDITVRVGIGNGSVCTTRKVTGVGYPQVSAIMDLREKFPNLNICADGGIRGPADIAKALAAGADSVMVGGMIARCKEAPAQQLGVYRGAASASAKRDAGMPVEFVEGVEVPIVGNEPPNIADMMFTVRDGLRSAFSYVGAHNITEFHELAEFVQVTPNTRNV